MSVLVKGMEKPEHCGYCRFRYDGICHALQKTQYSMNECPLVVIDDAGLNDTISRQAAIDTLMTILDKPNHAEFLYTDEICKALNELPSAQKDVPERIVGYWQMFDLITSAYYGKMMYSKQDNGIVYSRYSGKYMRMDEAINEFLALIGEERE